MERYDWRDLLERWNRDLLGCPRVVESLPNEVVRSGWLGYPPATEEQIQSAEGRLGVSLPPSYRQFLRTTNGWRTLGRWTGPAWSIEGVDLFQPRHPDLINDWLKGAWPQGRRRVVPDSAYFVYGEAQRPEMMRDEYLSTALEVSALGDDEEVYLLNPKVITGPNGEWEAWFFAHWIPGAERYRSFWELMESEYARFKC